MAITNEGKLRFYEIRPKRGSLKNRMLNPLQVKTIKTLLKHERAEEVCVVRYQKRKGKLVFDLPERLTASKIKRFSHVQ